MASSICGMLLAHQAQVHSKQEWCGSSWTTLLMYAVIISLMSSTPYACLFTTLPAQTHHWLCQPEEV